MLVSRRPIEGVLELRLQRPEQLNALTLPLARHLLEAVREGARDSSVRVLLLTAQGRAFCAGKDRDDPASAQFVEVLQGLASSLMQCPKPVVAAVQGWAVGAGVELLLNCDIVIAARNARFMLPEVNAGLFATGGALALLPRKIGMAKAKGALMLGQEFSALQAEQWGMIWKTVDEGELAAGALQIARQLAAGDPAILGRIKSLLHKESFGELQDVLEREAQAHRALTDGARAC